MLEDMYEVVVNGHATRREKRWGIQKSIADPAAKLVFWEKGVNFWGLGRNRPHREVGAVKISARKIKMRPQEFFKVSPKKGVKKSYFFLNARNFPEKFPY